MKNHFTKEILFLSLGLGLCLGLGLILGCSPGSNLG